MKVLLIGNYAADRQYSMLGFADALFTGLNERGIDARILAPSEVVGRFRLPKIKKWLGYADKFLVFPPKLKREIREADVVHICDHSNAMYTRYLERTPHLVTCHDLLAVRSALGELPEQKTGATGQIFQKMILQGLRRAQSVVCDSEASRHDLLRLGNIAKNRNTVVPIGLFYSMETMPDHHSAKVLTDLGIPVHQPSLLHVGGNQFYKNRLGLLKIYRALKDRPEMRSMPLVMAGKPFTEELKHYIAANDLAGEVIELVGLDNEQIRALYSRAKALIFPSLYEGFGLPVIEAQACGCPVFTSNRAPMTEIGGDAAYYFDPEQPAGAAQIIANALINLEATDAMIAAGFENVKRFSTERMIDGYLQAYEKAIAEFKK